MIIYEFGWEELSIAGLIVLLCVLACRIYVWWVDR